jgi:cellulose synthase/poly-beta-1,6-N-acetylglucosamine synthase-like glycosyltransferase
VQEFNDDRIKIIKASQDINGKKQAVEDGVDAAKFNWILQTDSDCMPASLDWIKWMIASRKKDTELVLGFSPAKSNSSFIGNIAAYETFYIGIQYLSYCLKRMPYMGVGRNILYNKQAFLRSQPYHDNKHIASGDDDFIVQKIANNLNTEICIEPNSFTYTVAPSTISEYVSQKNRHVTTSIMYTSKHKLLLGIFSAVHILFYFLIIWSLVLQLMSIKKIAGFYLLMTSVMWIIKLPIAVKLKQVSNLLWFHIADLFLSLFYILIALKIMQKREIKWK